MMFDYIDRQIIASMFPFLKSDWLLSDAQLGCPVDVPCWVAHRADGSILLRTPS
jgi:hypothetical protein